MTTSPADAEPAADASPAADVENAAENAAEPVPDRASVLTVTDDHRRHPRRRGQSLEEALLEAALAELEETGYQGLRMERVAELARASKASLYRRWPTKVQLVTSAAFGLMSPTDDRDTGTLRGDLLALLGSTAVMLGGPAGIAIRGAMSDALRDPDLAARFRSFTRGTTVQAIRAAVRRARERGELDAAPITDRQLEAGLSVLRFHSLTHTEPIPPDVVVGIVDEIMLPLLRAASADKGASHRGS